MALLRAPDENCGHVVVDRLPRLECHRLPIAQDVVDVDAPVRRAGPGELEHRPVGEEIVLLAHHVRLPVGREEDALEFGAREVDVQSATGSAGSVPHAERPGWAVGE